MSDIEGIVLARQPPFRLGSLSVRPGLRELVHDDGRREILEPRVMQVLVALTQAQGEIVTRDDLTRQCWDGRVVGEDAITRVISRLHRTAKAIGAGSFRVDTVVKVGYRLLEGGDAAAASEPLPASASDSGAPIARARRAMLAAGVGAVAAVGAGGGWLIRTRGHRLDAASQALYDRGWVALTNVIPEQIAQAVALFNRVVEANPNYADGWASLAMAYTVQAHSAEASVREGLRTRALAAATKATELEPDNPIAEAARVNLDRMYGNWGAVERGFRRALARRPRSGSLVYTLSYVLGSVGRSRDAATLLDGYAETASASPFQATRRTIALLHAGRFEEADRFSANALTIYPRNVVIWFTRFHLLVRTGRPDLAIALAGGRADRPPGIPDRDFEYVLSGAKAVMTRAAADIEAAIALNLEAARAGSGYAENSIILASMLGRSDIAFQMLDDQFSSAWRQTAFSQQQAVYWGEPRTEFLFNPGMKPLFRDPRFETLMQHIGLTEYWRASGIAPDYRRV